MKIAFLSPFYPYRGGIAEFSNSLFIELQKSQDIKAFSFLRQYPNFLFPGSSQFVLDTDIKKDINAKKVLDSINPFTYGKTARLISGYLPELVLISYWMPFFAPSLGRVAKKLRKKKIKVVSILHNVIPHELRFGDKFLTKYFLKNNDGVIVLNQKSENDLLKLKPDIKYITHPHPLYNHYGEKINSTEARTNLNIPKNKNIILYFGLIRDYKGLDLLIEAISMFDDNYYLIIAGEVYGNFKQYQALIDKNSLNEKIQLHIKYIPDSDVPKYFSAADVCVLPYKSGTQSGITGIAYHFDLPVIVTDVGGLKEMVEDGKTGLMVKEPNPKLIAQAILKYFDERMKEKMIPYIQDYKKIHSWDKLSADIIEFAQKIE